MLRKNNFYLLVLIEILFLFFIFLIIPAIFLKERPGINQTSFDNILPLDTKHSYLQTLVLDRNNLNSISVQLKNPSLKNNSWVDLEIQNKNQETIQSLAIRGSNIEDPSWVRFKFPTINSQIGDTVYLKITTDNQTKDSLYIYGNPDGKNINFKTTFLVKNFKESFLNNLNQQKDRFFKLNQIKTISYSTILIVLNILLFISL